MTRAEALKQLASANQRERLSAARVLSRLARSDDVAALKGALRVEPIPWIRSALEAGLARAVAAPAHEEAHAEVVPLISDDALAHDVYSRAVEELTDRFVHEFRPLVGLTRVHAQREIEDFETSHTNALLRRMQVLLQGIDTLGKASAAPKLRPTDLAAVVHEAAASCVEELRTSGADVPAPSMSGPDPLHVETDPDLLMLALRNGIKNALEASRDAADPIVITWDQSSVEYWVAVLDFGAGLPPDGRSLFAIGATTKDEHFGIGLAIVERVVSTLGGKASLESQLDGSTRFELRMTRGGAE